MRAHTYVFPLIPHTHPSTPTISRKIKFESSLNSHARSSEAQRDSRAGVLLQTNIFLLAYPAKHEMSLNTRARCSMHTRLDPSKVVTSSTRDTQATRQRSIESCFTLLREYYYGESIIIHLSRCTIY